MSAETYSSSSLKDRLMDNLMDLSAIAAPENSISVAPEDEIRFRYMANPFDTKLCRAKHDPDYVAFLMGNWHLPPPLPSPLDSGQSVLGIPLMWFWFAVGCADCDIEPDITALPVVIALWDTATKKQRREIIIDNKFLNTWCLQMRSVDRILKRLHQKSLLVYAVKNGKNNNATLLATPYQDE